MLVEQQKAQSLLLERLTNKLGGNDFDLQKESRQRLGCRLSDFDDSKHDSSILYDFFTRHHDYLKTLPLTERDGPSYVQHMRSCLSSTASTWFAQLDRDSIPFTRKDFLALMNQHWLPPIAINTIQDRLRNLRFHGYLSKFFAEYDRLIMQSRGAGVDDDLDEISGGTLVTEVPFSQADKKEWILRALSNSGERSGEAIADSVHIP